MYTYNEENVGFCLISTLIIVIGILILTIFIVILLSVFFKKYLTDNKKKSSNYFENFNTNLSDTELQLLNDFRKLDNNSKELVENTIKTLSYKSNDRY